MISAGSSGQEVFVHDRETGMTEIISVSTEGREGILDRSSNKPVMSGDGSFVVLNTGLWERLSRR